MSAIKITATVYDYSKFDEIEIVEGINYKDVVRDLSPAIITPMREKFTTYVELSMERTISAEVSA